MSIVPRALTVMMGGALVFTVLDVLLWDAAMTLSEDGFTESLSALTFGFGSVVAGIAVRTARHRQARIVAALICVSALMAGLSELSFGQRTSVFEYEGPVIRGVPIDAPHDFLFLGYEVVRSWFSGVLLWVVFGSLTAVGVGALWLMRGIINDFDTHSVATRYLLCGCALVLIALIIDLDFATHDFVYAMEEMLELDAALALTAGAAAQILHDRTAARSIDVARTTNGTMSAGPRKRAGL